MSARSSAALAFLLIALIGLVAVACGGEPPRPAALPVPGVAAFTVGVDLWLREDGEERLIVEVEEGRQALAPAIAPDGERIAFVLFQLTSGEGFTVGADLAIYDPDEGARIALEHQQRSEYFWNPRWTPDGEALIYTREAPGMEIAIEQLDLATGERRVLRERARDGDLSPDGRRLVFIDDPYGGAARLVVRDLQSGAEHPLDANGDWKIQVFRIPKWTPDGEWIVFAGSVQLESVSSVASFDANGPEDIWRVPAGGGRPQLIAAITEDQPDFAIAGDGRHLLARGSFGVYVVSLVQPGAPYAVAPGEFHGWHDWRGALSEAQWNELIERAAAGSQ